MTDAVYAHFIGIGGAGMSGLAKVLLDRGRSVSGSDLKGSRYSEALARAGAIVHVGHDAANLGDPEVVVVSSAIPDTNPELVAARERGIDVWQRARMLAHLGSGLKTVAVAGTHGKTTTSSMLAAAVTGVGADPTFLIGGELNDMGANARCGDGEHYVVEADESDGSFLHLSPHVALVTNVEEDHLDHYSGIEEIEETFCEFVGRTDADGALVLCADDPRAVALASGATCRAITYGMSEAADVRCVDVRPMGAGHAFNVVIDCADTVTCQIRVPGVHNVLNATGALAAVHALGLDVRQAAVALGGFGGVRRRFEHIGEVAGVRVVDDYAHHPTEVRATLAGARAAGYGRVWAVFQPHRYSRTEALSSGFGVSFRDADRVVLMDVYSAGEAPIPGVTGKAILDSLLESEPRTRAAYFPHPEDIATFVARRAREGDLVMTMGAGDVTALGPEIIRALEDVHGKGATSAAE